MIKRYGPWLIAILTVSLGLQVLLFYPRVESVPVYPEMTPEDKAELESIRQEVEEIKREYEKLQEQRQLLRKGKMWHA